MGQLDKIPNSANLVAEWKRPEGDTRDNIAEQIKVYRAYKSHGYQTSYQHIPVWLFALRFRGSWDVRELRDRSGERFFDRIIEGANREGLTRTV